ncbi:MAG: alpha/beta fold hydrolase [Pseudomonadota bacterium]|nr:alpha/beta fold hydrolase [Pseudomonadota bacterium]
MSMSSVGENQPRPVVYFAHGKESGPWGIKITALAEVARHQGFAVESPDYRGLSTTERIQLLTRRLDEEVRPVLLVGSSMGGYVSAVVANRLAVEGLFLLAPALYLPVAGYEETEFAPQTCEIAVVHGWSDDIVPVSAAQRFAQAVDCDLHLLRAGHTLNDRIPVLEGLFGAFLRRVARVDAPAAP